MKEDKDDYIRLTNSGGYWTITMNLRFKHKDIHNHMYVKSEPRLQQMWQCSDGSTRWEWVEYAKEE